MTGADARRRRRGAPLTRPRRGAAARVRSARRHVRARSDAGSPLGHSAAHSAPAPRRAPRPPWPPAARLSWGWGSGLRVWVWGGPRCLAPGAGGGAPRPPMPCRATAGPTVPAGFCSVDFVRRCARAPRPRPNNAGAGVTADWHAPGCPCAAATSRGDRPPGVAGPLARARTGSMACADDSMITLPSHWMCIPPIIRIISRSTGCYYPGPWGGALPTHRLSSTSAPRLAGGAACDRGAAHVASPTRMGAAAQHDLAAPGRRRLLRVPLARRGPPPADGAARALDPGGKRGDRRSGVRLPEGAR